MGQAPHASRTQSRCLLHGDNTLVMIRPGREEDTPALIALAAQAERWFGPTTGEPGFLAALARHISRGTALVATTGAGTGDGLLGGLLFSPKPPAYHVRWLVVAEHARRTGTGRALLADATHRFVTTPGTLEVVTFGADHPGASASGARAFYERLGFTPAEAAAPGPEGGSRQAYRKPVA